MHDFISLSAFWDNELPEPEKSRLGDHLAGCLLCQGWLGSVAALTRTLALFPDAPVPADFADRLDLILTCPAPAALADAHDPTVAAHLEICPSCRQHEAMPVSLGDALRQLPGYKAKPDFLSRLMAKLPVCPPFADLSAWVDGELTTAGMGELTEHLAECAPCSQRTVQLQALTGAVRALPTPTAPTLTVTVLGLDLCPSRTDLSAKVDGELGAATAAMDTHLAACGECRQVVAQFQFLGRGVQILPIPAVTSHIVACPEPAELVVEHTLPVALAEHVAGCEPCTARMTSWDLLTRAIQLLPAAPVRVGFAARIAATVVPACPDRLDLHAYHDGELSVTDRARLQPHFEVCAECQAVLTSFTRLSAAVTALPRQAAPIGFAFGVAARVPKVRPTPIIVAGTVHRMGWQWPSAMAAGMLVLGILIYLQPGTTTQTASVTPLKHERVELVAVTLRSEDLLLGESTNLSSPSLLDEWGQ
ncbi:MAG: zf-HC2 domain-containing protein [Candidatus Sericytochromatia bacterium]|nr:zf-HC2 domain-containing protein [Candidatus Sericytochromatia bacterium]